MVVLWNPSVRKCVGIPIPNVFDDTRIAFGVCPETNDPKLVKINAVKTPSISWEVQVFTLTSCVWKTVFTGVRPAFEIVRDTFGEVSIPERFVPTYGIWVVKVNESLGLLEYYKEGGMSLCGMWMRKDDVNNPFTKIYTVKVEVKWVFYRVLGFRNNGEVILHW
ncbi:hypothetical protein Tco_1429209 [Tanacetum coccineum]